MDEPLGVFTLSLARPAELLLHLIENVDPREVDDFKRGLSQEMGLSFDGLAGMIRNGAGGVALHPGGGRDPVSFLVFAKLNSRSAAVTAIEALTARDVSQGRVQVERHGDNVLYNRIRTYSSESIGLVENYFVIGNAMEPMSRLASGQAASWRPSCGGRELAQGEINIGKLLRAIAANAPPQIGQMLSSLGIGEESSTRLTASRAGNGLLIEAKGGGIGTALVAAGIAMFSMADSSRGSRPPRKMRRPPRTFSAPVPPPGGSWKPDSSGFEWTE